MMGANTSSVPGISDAEFREQVESGQLPVYRHELMLRIALIYLGDNFMHGGVFGSMEKLHSHGWSFGKGDLRFNRTLDIFYLSQLAACVYRSTNSQPRNKSEKSSYVDNFGPFYAKYCEFLHADVWKEYYTQSFIAKSARFWRLPNLRDLADSSDQLGGVRRPGVGHHVKLPRWAFLVRTTQLRQQTLPHEVIAELAISTLKETIERQRRDNPDIAPYSETQAWFWLEYFQKHFQPDSPPGKPHASLWSFLQTWGALVGQGYYDVREWKGHYTRQRWESTSSEALEPDLDGSRKSEVQWCGWPDGGVSAVVSMMGREEELGGEEEVDFLAAVAVKEVEVVDGDEDMDYAMRSHMLLGCLRAAYETDRAAYVEELKRRIIEGGRLDEKDVEPWVESVLEVMEPYAAEGAATAQRPVDVAGWRELLRLVLVENGQLFARWKKSGRHQDLPFMLKPRLDQRKTMG